MTLERINLGKLGEQEAVKLLQVQGYKIIERNFRTNLGEIDIIAQDNDTICFVEVRTKTSPEEGHPLESISPHKCRKLIQSAWCYAKEKNLCDANLRFDVVAVVPETEGQYKVELFKNVLEVG